MPNKMRALPLAIILGLYLVLGLAYTVINPVLEGPDEILNYENIRFIAEQKSLDVMRDGELSKAHHPPLYYAIGALATGWVSNDQFDAVVASYNPFWAYQSSKPGVDNKSIYLHDPDIEGWPYRDISLGVHLIRWLSLLMGAGVIVVIFFTARQLFPGEPYLAPGAAALVAFNPMFIYIQGSVHNDALTNLFAALILWGCVRYWLLGPSVRQAAFIGLVGGLGILTKITFLFLGPTVVLIMLIRNLKGGETDSGKKGNALRDLAIGGGVVLLIAGWWFVRNQIVYGEPTSMGLQAQVWGLRDNAPDIRAAIRELGFMRDSFWGAFGYGQIVMPGWVHIITRLLWLMAGAGLVLWVMRSIHLRRNYRVVSTQLALLLMLAPLTAFGATFARMTISATANFGRYLFTAYAVFAPFIVLGVTEWAPEKWRRASTIIVSCAFLVFSLGALVGVIAPAYAPPPIYAGIEEVDIQYPLDVEYPGLARLVGYNLSSETVRPGDVIDVTLFWQVTNTTDEDYVEFVQFVQHVDHAVGSRDTHPGLGRYPTSRWQPGQIIADTIPVTIDYSAEGPDGLSLDIGLHLEGERLHTGNGENTIRTARLRLEPREHPSNTATNAMYEIGEVVQLSAIIAPPDTVTPGSSLPVTFVWDTISAPDTDYSIFIHVFDASGQRVLQFDGPPANGTFPTSLWRAGDRVNDEHVMNLPVAMLPGAYQVYIGWYDLTTLASLPASDNKGETLPNNAIPVFQFRVVE